MARKIQWPTRLGHPQDSWPPNTASGGAGVGGPLAAPLSGPLSRVCGNRFGGTVSLGPLPPPGLGSPVTSPLYAPCREATYVATEDELGLAE